MKSLLAPLRIALGAVLTVLLRTLQATRWLLFSLLALLLAVVIHIDHPVMRRVAMEQVNQVLATTLLGQIEIQRLGHLGLVRVSDVEVVVRAVDGTQIASARGVSARLNTTRLLASLPNVRLALQDAVVEEVELAIDQDAAGELRLSTAFLPVPPEQPKPPSASTFWLELPELELRRVRLRNELGLPLQVELTGAQVSVQVAPNPLWTTEEPDAPSTRVEVQLKRVRARTEGVPPLREGAAAPEFAGVLGASFTMPSPSGALFNVVAAAHGALGGVPLTLGARLDGTELTSVVRVADADGRRLALLVPDLPKPWPTELWLSANGPLFQLQPSDAEPTLQFFVQGGSGGARALALGVLKMPVAGAPRLALGAAVEQVNLEAMGFGPASQLAASVRGEIELGDRLSGRFELTVPRGHVAGQVVPALSLRGTVDGDSLQIAGNADERGAPLRFDASLDESQRVRFRLAAPRVSLQALERVPAGVRAGGGLRGHANVTAEGSLQLPSLALDGRVLIEASKLQAQGVQVDAAVLRAKLRGLATAPIVELELEAVGVVVEGGPRLRQVEASSTLSVQGGGVRLTAPLVALHSTGAQGSEVVTKLSAEQVDVGAGVRVKNARIDGVGQPVEANVEQSARGLAVRLSSADIDVGALDRLLASWLQAPSEKGALVGLTGRAAVDVDVLIGAREVTGHVAIDASSLTGYGVRDAALQLYSEWVGTEGMLVAQLNEPALGTASLALTELAPGGAPLSGVAWQRATGKAAFSGAVKLGALLPLLPPSVPVTVLDGELRWSVSAAQFRAGGVPEIGALVSTQGLRVAVGTEWFLDGTDLQLNTKLEQENLHAMLRAADADGSLVRVDASTWLPASLKFDWPSLVNHPFTAKVSLPRRAMSKLPAMLDLGEVPGSVQLQAAAWGTIREPRFSVDAAIRSLSLTGEAMARLDRRYRAATLGGATMQLSAEQRAARQAARAGTLDVNLRADYNGQGLDARLLVGSQDKSLLELFAYVRANAKELFASRSSGPSPSVWERPWQAEARLQVNELPLELFPFLADLGLSGRVGGEVVLERYHRDARLKGALRIAELQAGAVRYHLARVDLDADAQRLKAEVAMLHTNGSLRASAQAETSWGAAPYPRPKDGGNLQVSVAAKAFQIGGLQPLLAGYLQQLDGVVDADLDVTLAPRSERPVITQGTVKLSRGVVQTQYFGDEFRDVSFELHVTPEGVAKLENLRAFPTDGEIEGFGSARLHGAALKEAELTLRIPRRKGVSLQVVGLALGEIYGEVRLAVDLSGEDLKMKVKVPQLSITMPSIPSLSVLRLERPQDLQIGYRHGGKLVPLPLDGTDRRLIGAVSEAASPSRSMHIAIELDRVDVAVAQLARLSLRGSPEVVIGDTVQMTGQIETTTGTIELQGKRFNVDRALLTFAGEELSNPTVVASASWTAQDQTRVIAEYVGPALGGRLILRAEPTRSESEILSLILFGSADGLAQSGAGSSSNAEKGLAMAGGAATQPLGQAMSSLIGLQTSTRIDTTNANNPRPEIEVQITPTVSVGFQHVLGTPPASDPDRNFAKFAWRFAAYWSLVTTIGDRYSTMMDAIWQYRY